MTRHFFARPRALLLTMIGGCALLLCGCSRPAPVVPVRIALPIQLASGSAYVGQQLGSFQQHGVDIALQPFQLGKQALEAVVRGNADLALVADTPFMFAALRGEPIATVATVFGSRRALAVLGWRNSGIIGVNDLDGKTVGTVAGINAQYFLDALLVFHGIERSRVKVVFLRPDQLANALRTRQVDAVTVWHPELGRLKTELGDAVVALYGDGVFVNRFLLVGRTDYLDAHGDVVARTLAGLADATDAVHEQPERARAIVGKAIGIAPDLIAEAFDPADYYLALDQSLLLALDDQTRWAMKQALVAPQRLPNYLTLLRQQPLRAARPNAVKVIQ